MGRLIDADKLTEAIVNRAGSETVLFNTTKELNAYLEGCAYKQLAILEMIADMPTAYDVEKVVAELEELEDTDTREVYLTHHIACEDAIEIVRKGGVE